MLSVVCVGNFEYFQTSNLLYSVTNLMAWKKGGSQGPVVLKAD